MNNPNDSSRESQMQFLESRKIPWPETLVVQSNPGIPEDLRNRWENALKNQMDSQRFTEQYLNNFTNDGGPVGMKLSFDERRDRLTATGITAEEFFKKEYLCDFTNDDREYDKKGNPTGRRYHKTQGNHISSAIFDELDIDGD